MKRIILLLATIMCLCGCQKTEPVAKALYTNQEVREMIIGTWDLYDDDNLAHELRKTNKYYIFTKDSIEHHYIIYNGVDIVKGKCSYNITPLNRSPRGEPEYLKLYEINRTPTKYNEYSIFYFNENKVMVFGKNQIAKKRED